MFTSPYITPPPSTQNIFQMCVDEELTSVEDVYYFEGDYWYNQLEDFIAELDKEELELKQLEEQEVRTIVRAYMMPIS